MHIFDNKTVVFYFFPYFWETLFYNLTIYAMKYLLLTSLLLLRATTASSCIALQTTRNTPPRQHAIFTHPSPQAASDFMAISATNPAK